MRLIYDGRFLGVSGVISVILKINLWEFVRYIFRILSNAVYVLDKAIKVRLWPLMPWSACHVSCIIIIIFILVL